MSTVPKPLRWLAHTTETPACHSICFALLHLALAATQAAEPEMMASGEMEGPFINGLAQRWVANCYGSNEVVFVQESADVHGGKSAQRVTCTRFDDGGVQFHSGDIEVRKGQPYTLRLWLKGELTGSVYVGIRKHGPPYTPYLKRDVRVKKDWTPVNGFALDEQVVHSGRFSARLEESMSRGELAGIECRPFPVRTGRRYTLSAWIRAAAPNTRIRLRLFEWADAGGDFPENRHEREITITATTEWARYQLSGILLPNLHEGYVARFVPSGRIWLDDVQVEEGSQTEYQPAQPLEVGAETPTRWCRVAVTADAAPLWQPGRCSAT